MPDMTDEVLYELQLLRALLAAIVAGHVDDVPAAAAWFGYDLEWAEATVERARALSQALWHEDCGVGPPWGATATEEAGDE